MTTSLTRWAGLVAGVALAVALVGCAEADVDAEDVRGALVDDGVPEGVADCVTDEVVAALDQSEINDLYTADEASPAAQAAVDEAVAACT